MAGRGRSSLALEGLLDAVEAGPPVAAADVVGAALADALGASEVSFLICDFAGDSLVRLGRTSTDGASRTHGDETAETVPLAGTPHGRALEEQRLQVVREDEGARIYAPVTSRGEAVGVLELRLEESPDARVRADVAAAAHALAYVIIANRRYTDLFEWGQRSVPLSLAAEIQHRLLPQTYTCEGAQFTVAGWLEPAGDVGGDTFDFSLDRRTLHLSMTDAMGHDVAAAILATVLVGAFRNARRRGVDLAEQARSGHAALAEHARDGGFATGQLVRIDLETQTARIVNAGHPRPLRVRSERIEEIVLSTDLPFGVREAGRYVEQELPLEAGDRLVFLTDGMLDRNARAADILDALSATRGEHPREVVRRLTDAVQQATGGHLRDDATVLVLDWHGGPPRDRQTGSGADL